MGEHGSLTNLHVCRAMKSVRPSPCGRTSSFHFVHPAASEFTIKACWHHLLSFEETSSDTLASGWRLPKARHGPNIAASNRLHGRNYRHGCNKAVHKSIRVTFQREYDKTNQAIKNLSTHAHDMRRSVFDEAEWLITSSIRRPTFHFTCSL